MDDNRDPTTAVGVTRRGLIVGGAAGAGVVVAGIAGVSLALQSDDGRADSPGAGGSTDGGPPLPRPDVLESSDGVLAATLTLAPASLDVAGSTVTMLAYNGSVPGPTLHARPGDTLRLALDNQLDEATNLHTHGLHVDATGNGDNPFRHVASGESAEYVIELPDDHPHGVFWYHPHLHGSVADQVFAGLYGAIVVDREDWSDGAPEVVVVSDSSFSGGRVASVSTPERRMGRIGDVLMANGAVGPTIAVPQDGPARLLLVNACTSRYLDLEAAGATWTVRGRDSGAFDPAREVDVLTIPPGGRADAQISAPADGAVVVARGRDQGPGGGMMMMSGASWEDAGLLALVPDASAPVASTPALSIPRDLATAAIDARRVLEFGMAMGGGGMRFTIDGAVFDPERVDQHVRLGTVEEWTVRNRTGMAHPFHLHVWPMQVLRDASGDVEAVDARDVVDVPAGGEVVVRIAFERFAGPTVYHCHILDHEDLGMMGIVEAS